MSGACQIMADGETKTESYISHVTQPLPPLPRTLVLRLSRFLASVKIKFLMAQRELVPRPGCPPPAFSYSIWDSLTLWFVTLYQYLKFQLFYIENLGMVDSLVAQGRFCLVDWVSPCRPLFPRVWCVDTVCKHWSCQCFETGCITEQVLTFVSN